MALIQCKECGGTVSDKAATCPHCGCPVEMQQSKIVCPECGQLITEDEKKCPNCGCPSAIYNKIKTKSKNVSHTRQSNSIKDESKSMKEEKNTPPKTPVKKEMSYQHNGGRINVSYNNRSNFIRWIGVIIILCLVGVFFLWKPFSNDSFKNDTIKITTPKNDGRICAEMIRNAKTLKELDEVSQKVYKYVDAYETAVYEGIVTMDEANEFVSEIGVIHAVIEERAAQIGAGM